MIECAEVVYAVRTFMLWRVALYVCQTLVVSVLRLGTNLPSYIAASYNVSLNT